MKLYKLNQGSTFENLKHFIYLTNEYGVPSDEFVDDFIEQFGLAILNCDFTSVKIPIQPLELHWQSIKEECTQNNIEYREYYGGLFYEIMGQKALLKIKNRCGEDNWKQLSTNDKLELLKQFILDFDLHIFEGIDIVNKELIFENTMPLIESDENGVEYIPIYMDIEDIGECKARLYRNGKVVIKTGSCIVNITPHDCDDTDILKMVQSNRKGYTDCNKVIKDITFDSPSTAAVAYCGGALNGWKSWRNKDGEAIEIYKEEATAVRMIGREAVRKEYFDSLEAAKCINKESMNKKEKIKLTYKASLQYRQNPIILYNKDTTIELYHPINNTDVIEYRYKIIRSNIEEIANTEYIDISELLDALKIYLDDFCELKYGNNAPIMDLIKHIGYK